MYALFDHDHFPRRLERVAKFIDELGADAVTIKQLNEAVEISVPVVEKYCDYALREIAWFGRLR